MLSGAASRLRRLALLGCKSSACASGSSYDPTARSIAQSTFVCMPTWTKIVNKHHPSCTCRLNVLKVTCLVQEYLQGTPGAGVPSGHRVERTKPSAHDLPSPPSRRCLRRRSVSQRSWSPRWLPCSSTTFFLQQFSLVHLTAQRTAPAACKGGAK